MRTPLRAMLWELWRRSRLELLLRIGVLLLMALALGSNVPQLAGTEDAHVLIGVLLLFFMPTSIASSTWIQALDRQQTGFGFRLGFIQPVSTAQLVAVPMVYAVATGVLCFALPASLLRLLTGLEMPIVGPATVVAAAVACFIAATWSPTTIIGKAIGFAALASSMGVALVVYHTQRHDPAPILMAIGAPEYHAFGWHVFALLLTTIVLAYAVTVVAVDQQRHGDGLLGLLLNRLPSGPRVRARWLPGRRRLAESSRPFSSRFVAQCWYEARRLGPRVFVFSLVAPLLVFVFLTIGAWQFPGSEGAPLVWLGALLLCPFLYQIAGTEAAIGLSNNQGAMQLSTFDATRTMPSDRIIASKLLMVAVCSLIGWLLMGLAAVLHAGLVGDADVWVRLGNVASRTLGDVPVYWWAAGLSSIVLLYVGTSSMILAAGLWLPSHPKTMFCGLIAVWVDAGLVIWDASHGWQLRNLWIGMGYVMSFATVIACIVALKKSLTAGFLSNRLFASTFCVWLIYVATSIAAGIKVAPAIPMPIPTVMIFVSVSWLLVPLAATALAPLALAAHRHA